MPAAARITPITHRSCPTPGVLVPFERGASEVQPSRPAPPEANQPCCMTSPPHSQVHMPARHSRGPDSRVAPICSGTRYIAIAIAIGVTNR